MDPRKLFKSGLVASAVLALCCVTPVLLIGATALGLSAWAGWLDWVLIPALLLSVGFTAYAWRRCRQDEACRMDARPGDVGQGGRP
jgi:mercuric ion transport protein